MLLGAVVFVVVVERSASAQGLPVVSITCPASVPAVAHGAWGTGAAECTFTASSVPNGAVTVKYQVSGTGDRSLEYEGYIDVAAAVTKDLVHYFRDTTTVTVRLLQGTGYTLGSPSEASIAVGPTPTPGTGVGVRVNEPGVLEGYTLLTGTFHNRFYLIDNQGREAYRWDRGGALGKLLDSGNLLTGHTGANIREVSPDGTAAYEYPTDAQHHDVVKLPNGNYLFIGSAYYSRAQSIAAGANPACLGANGLEIDEVIEFRSTGTSGGVVVWKWSVWDHLIQDHDSSKNNYGVVADHPELIDLNHGLCELRDSTNAFIKDPHHHTHLNSIDYNASLDQILITSRHFSEVWVIDHSTTTAQAAGSTGGNSGMGGDLIYRWGNPRAHKGGAKITQELFFPHNAHWIPGGLPGAGHVLVYNNGHEHPGFMRNYATVDEVVFPASGYRYLRAGGTYMPPTTVWTYRLAERTWILSNAQRLPNGNTLVTEGYFGRISEVTQSGRVVWHYVSPLMSGTGVRTGDAVPANDRNGIWVYRAYKYAADHPGIQALSLAPASDRRPIEQPDSSVPSVSVSGGGGVTEGAAAVFTVTASPAPGAALTVNVSVSSVGGYAAAATRTVTIPTAGSATLSVATIGDSVDEADGSVTVTVTAGTGYTVGSPSAATVAVSDDDETAPSVSVSGGGGVIEGAAAVFTVTASPAPGAALTVNVSVSSSGGYAAAATRTVTIPVAGSATLSVATVGDSVDEADGSVTVTVTAGTGYTVGSPSAATVAVSDDDDETEDETGDETETAPPVVPQGAADVSFVAPPGGTSASLNGRGQFLAVVRFAPGEGVRLRLPGACNTVGAVTYRLVDFSTGLPLGAGLSFDAATRTISGTPTQSGNSILKLVATDSGGTADGRANTAEFVFRLRLFSSYAAYTNTSVDCTSSATNTGVGSDPAPDTPGGRGLLDEVTVVRVEGGHVPRLRPGTIRTLFAPSAAAAGSPAYRYVNDHAVYRDTDGKWHVIGTANNRSPGQTAGEYQFAHGSADSLLGPYIRRPDIDPNGAAVWAFAPHAVTFNGQAYMFYGPKDFGLVTSSDMETWTNQTLNVTYPAGGSITDRTTPRDAMVLLDGAKYYMYVTSVDPSAGNQNVVDVLESTDLINWAYVGHALTLSGDAPKTRWSTAESPFVVKYSGLYYLFVTVTDTNAANDNYHQTLVFRSDSPTDFGDFDGDKVDPQGAQLVTELPVHAPEVVLDPATNKWYITTAGWETRQRYAEAADGVAIIEMEWVVAPANETPIPNTGWTLHAVSSQSSDHPATHAFDRDPTTYWESGAGGQPHTLDINLGATYDLNGLVYVPEPHGSNGGTNGAITTYRLHISTDATDWGDPVASGAFDNSIIDNNARKLVTFPTKQGQYIRLVSTAAAGGSITRVQDLGALGSHINGPRRPLAEVAGPASTLGVR